MAFTQVSIEEKLKMEIRKLKEELAAKSNAISLLETRLKQYGWSWEKETEFGKKTEAQKIATILMDIASCYTDSERPDYNKVAQIFSQYGVSDVPKTAEECEKFDKRLMKILFLRATDENTHASKYLPNINYIEFENEVKAAIRIRCEKNPKKLILRNNFLGDDEIEVHNMIAYAYNLSKRHSTTNTISLSIANNPISMKFTVKNVDEEISKELFDDYFIALSQHALEKLMFPDEVPEEFIKNRKYRCNFSIKRVPPF